MEIEIQIELKTIANIGRQAVVPHFVCDTGSASLAKWAARSIKWGSLLLSGAASY